MYVVTYDVIGHCPCVTSNKNNGARMEHLLRYHFMCCFIIRKLSIFVNCIWIAMSNNNQEIDLEN